jgi:hydrogenase expression/formation protein HypC
MSARESEVRPTASALRGRPRSDRTIPVGVCEVDTHCITCGDVAIPLTVLKVDPRRELALCEAEGGEHSTVEIALVAPVAPGDRLLVHAGTAIGRAE